MAWRGHPMNCSEVGTAQNFIWLCCARAVAGIGGAGLMVVIMVMISQMVPLQERGRYMGAMYARLALTNVLGPVLGGTHTSHVHAPAADNPAQACGIAIAFILLLIHKLPDRKHTHAAESVARAPVPG
ncbi:hypothetical protein WOLCODRAFT_155827 [Wolfiporia cocos MD-104 SS10]|uniref:Major facilitator superfamily (MFS) profile domain-containing protein n=1 Tax=Wolfiporia cocos (strain MD-104) TaxID=742152 RepID=A0A2H3IYS5_WOLCO|nr:hypothetical protein WOLCODRAFT_155827 [Wolfiporia cocos MD-104 SS10]